jgi:ABC-type multidrug transport system ATPase subunit
MNNQFVIETQNLTKSYGKFTAVDGLNMQIAEGEVFGFLGPNGAGKTTTILMLMGFCEPSSGQVRVIGYNPAREPIKVKKVVGYMPEKIGFYDDLTARENLEYTGRLNINGQDRWLVERCGLEGQIQPVGWQIFAWYETAFGYRRRYDERAENCHI